MTDINSEEARAARRQRVLELRPRASNAAMPREEFEREYERPFIVQDALLDHTERLTQEWFCPACPSPKADGLSQRIKLYVTYDEDPLRNYAALVTLCCYGCGWNEMLPVMLPENPERLAASHPSGQNMSKMPEVWSGAIMDNYKNTPAMQSRGIIQNDRGTQVWAKYDMDIQAWHAARGMQAVPQTALEVLQAAQRMWNTQNSVVNRTPYVNPALPNPAVNPMPYNEERIFAKLRKYLK